MNKKEVLEIRKQFTPENCAITRIAGCYVNHDKEKKMEKTEAFLSLPEEQAFKYFDIFKKTLSGNVGKNLLNLGYAIDAARNGDPDGEAHWMLMELRKIKLTDSNLLDAFYDKIIESYDCAENYYIVLIHAAYDVPGKTSDGVEMEDASDEVYDFILCSICPVKLSKAGLSFNGESVEERTRDWVVDMPDKGFLFPAFNDRSTDIHSLLYYTKKSAEVQEHLVRDVLGIDVVASADEQKDVFARFLKDTLGENPDFDMVKDIYDGINVAMIEHEYDVEPYKIDKNSLRKILENCGAVEGDTFDEAYRENIGNMEIMASNICDSKNISIQLADGKMTIATESIGDVTTTEINGRKYIAVPAEYVEVNGIMAKV